MAAHRTATIIPGMPLPSPSVAGRLTAGDALRLSASCGHVLIPRHPVAAGYRYLDLGGDTAPYYLRRLSLGQRTAAIALRGPVERSSGDEAERGAPALARCELSIGPRRVGWDELPRLVLRDGESSTLAHRALAAICELEALPRGACPLCSG